MGTVRLIHWNAAEAKERAEKIRKAGYQVDAAPLDGQQGLKKLGRTPPVAIVIDLSRLPMHGRDVALFVRHSKSTRRVPIVFVAGEPDKVARVKRSLPDAVYAGWSRITTALKRAIANPPSDPLVPKSAMAGYSGTPLPRKLGVKADSIVALLGAPAGFEETLGDLPAGVTLRRQARGRCDLAIWFARSKRDVERRVKRMGDLVGDGGLWICWPKKASGVRTDLTQNDVRRIGLAAGLVDYKIAAIDDTWSGLKFTRRRKKARSR